MANESNNKITFKLCASVLGGLLLLVVSGTQALAIKHIIQNGTNIVALKENEFDMEARLNLQKELGEIKAAIQVISAKLDRNGGG